MSIKKQLKYFLPPIFLDLYKNLFGKGILFSGNYMSWREASANATGYDSDSILAKVIVATNKVTSGETKFERDGVTFDVMHYPFPLIATLLRASTENRGQLTVLDFGGALGSSYYQCRDFLQGVNNLHWCVVEQAHFVESGSAHFATKNLSFFYQMKDVWTTHQPNVILFSGVLQYLPEPFVVLKEAIDSQVEYIIIDRTPFIEYGVSIISLQKVPTQIINSSYPVWLFNESEFKQIFSGKYSEITSFDALDGVIGQGRLKANFKGIVFKIIRESEDTVKP